LWVTFDTPQSRSLLRDRRRLFVPPVGERDVIGVCRTAFAARRLMQTLDVSAVVSTGSALALSFLPYAAMRGVPAHYIESSARVAAPSLTGRILERVPGLFLYRQYPHAARGRWTYGGSVFEGYRAAPSGPRSLRRVVVTVGSVEQSFRRLIDRLVALLPAEAEVLWQTGHTPVDRLAIEARPFLPAAELDAAMRAADVVVAHAGCGSALAALNAGRLPVLVARDPRRGELIDGHQIQLARWLAQRGLALERTPEGLAMGDLEHAAACQVVRSCDTEPFRLAETV
jgi:UDP-N-acetylglucosamine transferase subunit ALG13